LEYPAGGDPHDPDLGFTNGVNDIVTLGNGDQLAATRSYWYGDNVSQGLTQLNPNGTYNPSFTPGSGIYGGTGPVEVIVPQANGNLMVGGGFSEYGGVSRSGIARLHADGTLDTTFDPGTGFRADAGPPNVVSIIPSGSGFIIGGAFTLYNGVYRGFVARVEADGSLDQTFATGSGFDLQVNAMAVQPDGKVLVAGNFYHYNGVEANGSARLFPNGELDTSFTAGTGLDGVVTSLALQPDGKALVGGYFSHYNGIARNGIARLYAYTPPQQQFPVNGCVTAGGTTSIPTTGTKQLMKAGCRTNAGQVIGVTVGARLRGDLRLDTLYCKKSNGRITATSSTGRGDGSRYCRSGVLRIRTHGKHLQIRVTWSAPPKGAYTAYRTSRNYRN
ncbi:MAG: delta-60 repeat domain-containing protein, partial [Actinomycetes bacterium]